MSFLTRVKYLFGTLLVLSAVGALTVHLNDRISTVHAAAATLTAHEYPVGTSYSGLLVANHTHVGDTVHAGDVLFVVQSNDLARDIANHAVKPAKAPYDVRHHDELVIRAPSAGKVVKVGYVQGAFLPPDAKLASIQKAGTMRVDAKFHLSPREYALIRKADAVQVTLPNDRTVRAKVTRLTVTTKGDQAETEVRARAPQFDNRGLFSAGTPVRAQVRLNDHGVVHRVQNVVAGLLVPGGER